MVSCSWETGRCGPIRENSCFKVKQWKKDFSGRIVSALATLNGLWLNLVNIYAPTNPSERKVFFDSIPDFFFPQAIYMISELCTV